MTLEQFCLVMGLLVGFAGLVLKIVEVARRNSPN